MLGIAGDKRSLGYVLREDGPSIVYGPGPLLGIQIGEGPAQPRAGPAAPRRPSSLLF